MQQNTIANIAQRVRADFPILTEQVNGKTLVYFDNGATTQKPKQVIDAIVRYYMHENANIHRGVHTLSQKATEKFEQARHTVQKHINAANAHEIIFTAGTTASINLVAYAYGKRFVSSGDEIVISEMEHHSNILPWQQLCEDRGAVLKVIPVTTAGELDMNAFAQLLNTKTKIVAVTHVSNTLGTVNPVKEIIALAHSKNIPVLVDGAQAVPHMAVDVQQLDADFYCFSGHKAYGPTGIGVLYGKEKWLKAMPPYQVGGGVIKTVRFDKTDYADLPLKFEAGTPHMDGAIGLAAALDFMNAVGVKNIEEHEQDLLAHAGSLLAHLPQVKVIGTAAKKAGVLSFVIEGQHPFDVGTLLDKMGIAVRTGHHCTQPLMQRMGIVGTIRASFAVYNTKEEVELFVDALKKAIKMLS